MKNKIVAIVPALSLLMGVGVASADTFSTSTAVTSVTTLVSDVATIMGGTVGVILGLMAALLGLGWAVRKFKSKVTGKKF